ncbi:MAG TPA: NDP-sugar synthase [Dehalococcoidia bacterium]|nr:NDP-sugar synthase [Dehalococcoidia bacterium]
MLAVVLSGGLGTRLRPLTYTTPKQLVPVLNRPLIEHLLAHLAGHGVDTAVIAGSAGNTAVEERYGDGARLGLALRYSYEDRPLGSGLAVKQAARGVRETFFVLNGDIVTDADLTEMLRRHRERRAVLSIMLHPVDEPWHFGVAEVDRDGWITGFEEKPARGTEKSNLINAGVWIFEPEVLDLVPDDERAMIDGYLERRVFPELIASGGRVLAFVDEDAYWIDVGSPERYLQVNLDLLEVAAEETAEQGTALLLEEGASVDGDAYVAGPVLVGAGARVAREARLFGPCVIGPRCEIGEGATVEDSVLWEGAVVEADAVVERSILGRRARAGERAVIRDCVLADDVAVARGVTLPPGTRADPGTTFR